MSRVEKLYQSKKCDELFQEAREAFEDPNGEDAWDAADWIYIRLLPDEGSDDEFDDDEQNELFEMIIAGLT